MNRLIHKPRKNQKTRITNGDKRFSAREKRIKKPGLENDAFFKDSASSIDVCI